MAVPTSLEVKSVAELVAMARAHPGALNWAGTTGSNEFLFAAFLKNAGLSMSKVPYRNLVEAANDLAIGRIQVNVTVRSCDHSLRPARSSCWRRRLRREPLSWPIAP